MSGFTRAWLALREGADARARDGSLVCALAESMPAGRDLHVVDLGSGSGANLRHLAPRLGFGQRWTLVDNDPDLLEVAPLAIQVWADTQGLSCSSTVDGLSVEGTGFSAELRWLRLDLASRLVALPLREVDLVTASALLDLVSRGWIDRLARRCFTNRCVVLFALSYDGRVIWRPPLVEDEPIRLLVNRHQRGDKGFGAAAGPHAVVHARRRLQSFGYRVQERRSDWRLDGADASLQAALAQGWARAAEATDGNLGTQIAGWLDKRLAHIAQGESGLTVGHVDLLGLP